MFDSGHYPEAPEGGAIEVPQNQYRIQVSPFIQYARTHVDIILTNFVDALRQFGASMHML